MKFDTLTLLQLCASEYNNIIIGADSRFNKRSILSVTEGSDENNQIDYDDSNIESELQEVENEMSILLLMGKEGYDRWQRNDRDGGIQKKGRSMTCAK